MITWGATDFAPRVSRGSHRTPTGNRSGSSRYGHVVRTIWRIAFFGSRTLSQFTLRGSPMGTTARISPKTLPTLCAPAKTREMLRMKVSCSEGIAIHTGPESCILIREGGSEALTGVRAGRVLSRESESPLRGADDVERIGRPYPSRRHGETRRDPARSKTLCMRGCISLGSREVPHSPVARIATGSGPDPSLPVPSPGKPGSCRQPARANGERISFISEKRILGTHSLAENDHVIARCGSVASPRQQSSTGYRMNPFSNGV